ncbi:MAG: hypothetical protein ABI740_05900 [Alphaproteobacteria bacterium]
MKISARLAMAGAGALIGAVALAPLALAQLKKTPPIVWECKVERRIDAGKTTMYDEKMRASATERLVFVAETGSNRGCLLDPAKKDNCGVMFTGASEGGGMLRLDRMDENQHLDLVNIFPSSGRFIRIHGDTQWVGKPGDCVAAKDRTIKLP